jgi:hypothetical protein
MGWRRIMSHRRLLNRALVALILGLTTVAPRPAHAFCTGSGPVYDNCRVLQNQLEQMEQQHQFDEQRRQLDEMRRRQEEERARRCQSYQERDRREVGRPRTS